MSLPRPDHSGKADEGGGSALSQDISGHTPDPSETAMRSVPADA